MEDEIGKPLLPSEIHSLLNPYITEKDLRERAGTTPLQTKAIVDALCLLEKIKPTIVCTCYSCGYSWSAIDPKEKTPETLTCLKCFNIMEVEDCDLVFAYAILKSIE